MGEEVEEVNKLGHPAYPERYISGLVWTWFRKHHLLLVEKLFGLASHAKA